MRELINILRKYYLFFLFLLLESIAIILMIQTNDFQRARTITFARNFAAQYYRKLDNLREYMSLREINRRLVDENAHLRNLLKTSYRAAGDPFTTIRDTSGIPRYRFTWARVVNNTTNHRQNYITLDRGSEDGIGPDMAVVTDNGIVGIVVSVSPHFSQVISLLNTQLSISAKLLRTNEPGKLEWRGRNPRKALLTDIPHDISIRKGDTVVTSGFSPIFPEGWTIGYVEDFSVENGIFYEADINLSNDFRKLQWVYVIENLLRDEQLMLENKSQP